MKQTYPERDFRIIPKNQRKTMVRRPRAARRSWEGILQALVAGEDVFVPLYEIADEGKYLRTALARRGKGELLRTMRDVGEIKGQTEDGYRLWIVTG